LAISRGTEIQRPAEEESNGIARTFDISGEWQAEVIYDWSNASHAEVFSFKMEDGEVLGTASFLGTKRALLDGKISGNKLTFITKTQECSGTGEPRDARHEYRGRILGNEIRFVMLTEGGYSQHLPIEFTARRKSNPSSRTNS
jgi:hypothetical protein